MRYLTDARAHALEMPRASFASIYRGSALILHTIKGGVLKEGLGASSGRRASPLAGRTLTHQSFHAASEPEGIHDPSMFQDRRFHREALVLLQNTEGGTSGTISIGRVGRCHVVINDYSVSGSHAKFIHQRMDQSAAFRDEGSKNGTYINGEKLQPGVDRPIHTGDCIRMGRVEMIYIDARDFYAYLRGEFSNLQLEAAFQEP